MIGNYQINAQTLAHVNWQSFDGAIVPGKKLLSNQENVSLKFFGYVENNEPNIEAILKEVAVLFAVRDISGALRLEEILNDSDKGHLSNILPKRYLKSFPVLITEELKGSKLLERVVKIARDQTEQMISSIFKQVMITLNGCHEKGILIRSLSANSIVYANDSAQSLRLVDFSKAVNLYGRDAHFDTLIGQPEHIAPETMTIHSTQKQAIYSKATDVWQAGCILYVLLHAKLPFGNQNDIIQQQNLESRICNGLFIDTVNTLGVSDEAKNLLQRMLAVNPSERISTAEVLKHPWIANNDSLPKEKFNSEYLSRLKLMVGNAFTNSTSTSMQATQTPATEKVQSPIALTPGTRMFQVVCPGLKIPVRNEPNPSSSILTYLTSGAVVYVMCKAQSGYYQLADQPGYFNKNTSGLQLLETTASVAASSTSDSSDISSTSLPSSDTPQQSPNTERFLSSPSKFATSAVPKSSTVTPVEITDKSIDMSNQKQGDKICGHRCSLALTEKCCACSDQRPVVDKYEMYVDGEGWKFTDSIRRGDYYCPECRALCIGVQKESWELVQDMRLAGKSIQKVHTAGYGLKDIKKAGYTLDEVTYSNLYEEWELRKSGYTAAELHSAGYTPEQLKTTGYSNDELTELGIDQETLWRLGDVGADY